MLTELATVLRAGGLPVTEVAGWKTRGVGGAGLKAVKGGLCHWTATAPSRSGDYPSLAVVRDGRSDLRGPLSQLGLSRSGVWLVIAAGKANHAGAVDNINYSNDYSIGVEAEYHPSQGAWPTAQYNSYVKGCAVLGAHYGIVWRGHNEAATPKGRKLDPGFDMNKFRQQVKEATMAALDGDKRVPATDYRGRFTDGNSPTVNKTIEEYIVNTWEFVKYCAGRADENASEIARLKAEISKIKAGTAPTKFSGTVSMEAK